MHHDDFKNDDDTSNKLYLVKRLWQVQKSGNPNLFFKLTSWRRQLGGRRGGTSTIPMVGDDHLGGRTEILQAIKVLHDVVKMDNKMISTKEHPTKQ